jgi:hypothetical protein
MESRKMYEIGQSAMWAPRRGMALIQRTGNTISDI